MFAFVRGGEAFMEWSLCFFVPPLGAVGVSLLRYALHIKIHALPATPVWEFWKSRPVSEEYTTKRLLALRRVTRSASELISGQARDYLQTLNFVARPRSIYGEFIASSSKDTVRGAEGAFAELKTLYTSVTSAKPFNLRLELPSPLVNLSLVPEITPWEYTHIAQSDQGGKKIAVTNPLRWVLHYAPYPPKKLMELVQQRDQATGELQQAVIHYLMMHTVLQRQSGMLRLFAALRLPIEFTRLPGCGDLPITIVASEMRTVLPPDPVLVESTEISGRDAFEEVVDLNLLQSLNDPLKVSLQELVQREPELK
jgi:hypothetical protein